MSDPINYQASHVGLCVSDLDAALRFWCDGLGFDKAETFEVGAEFGASLEVEGDVQVLSQFIRKGAMAIELLHYHSPGVFGAPSMRRNQLGLTHTSFIVDDLAAATAHLIDCGGTLVEGTEGGDPATIELLFLADPDGNRVELLKYPS